MDDGVEMVKAMENMLVYPYSKAFAPVIRHSTLLAGINIEKIVSPAGWGLTGKQGTFVVEKDFETSLNHCDKVLFVEADHPLSFEQILLPKIKLAAQKGKKIIFARDFSNEEKEQIDAVLEKSGTIFQFLDSRAQEIHFEHEKSLLKIDTPVVFVMGTSRQSDKYETQLALREEFLKMGYHLSQVGSREYCELLGFHSMPSFMFNHTVDESDKIRYFNHFVKKIELEEKPELIVIGIPGGALPFSDKLKNDFGVTAFEISQALTPDYTIVNSLYEDYTEAYFKSLSQGIEKRLGFAVDSHVLSTHKIDWMQSELLKELDFLSLSEKIVEEKVSKLKSVSNLYNIYDENDVRKIAEDIIQKLSGYAYVRSI